MGLIDKIKSFEKRMNVNNNRIGYKFNKWVFNIMILLMVIICLFVWADYDFGDIREPHLYYVCEPPEPICRNDLWYNCNNNSPMYNGGKDFCDSLDPSMYESEFLFMGESIGEKPSFLAENAGSIFVLLILGAFVVNHYLNKRGNKK